MLHGLRHCLDESAHKCVVSAPSVPCLQRLHPQPKLALFMLGGSARLRVLCPHKAARLLLWYFLV